MDDAPKNRGGRPRKAFAPVGTPVVQPPEAVKPIMAAQTPDPAPASSSARRRRKSVGVHALKLSAPVRPGYTRRWANDDNNRIADMHELGYDHVTEAGIKTSDPGSRVSRLVGTKANGEPLRAFLMETPDELYAEGLAEKEAHNRHIDEAIAAGRDSTGQHQSDGYVGRGSIQRDR